jgi:aminoglycoside 6-adenylyltransferase
VPPPPHALRRFGRHLRRRRQRLPPLCCRCAPHTQILGRTAGPRAGKNDFWYHTVWSATKLRRGELFIAKSCCANTMKRRLREMIEWHARVTHGWDYDAWHDGRFLDQWADPRAVAGLRNAYAHCDEADVRRAVFATMDPFRWLATETAGRLGFGYPTEGDRCATTCLSGWTVASLRSQPEVLRQ